MKSVSDYDPADPAVIESPWEFFSALRRDAPLYELPNKAYYLVTRYEDVMRAVMDTETFSSNLVAVLIRMGEEGGPRFLDVGGNARQENEVLAIADPPDHTRHRRTSNRAFTMRKVAAMEPGIRALSNDLIDRFIGRGRCDWVEEFAVMLPMTIIVRMLGLPEEDIAQLKVWSDHSVGLLNGVNTPEDVMRHSAEILNLVQYLSAQVESARQNRTAGVILDLIDEAESGSDNINRNEIVAILLQLLTAGNETTTSLIGSAMLMLLKSPELQQELRNHPEKIEPFIEEALRTESPFFGHFRLVKKDTHIGGQLLPRGSRVMLVWASANRDESVFESASAIDINRERPRFHIAFGYGIHQCIGAALARAEARIAFETMLGRTRHLQLSEGEEPRHVSSLFVRSLERLHIEFK